MARTWRTHGSRERGRRSAPYESTRETEHFRLNIFIRNTGPTVAKPLLAFWNIDVTLQLGLARAFSLSFPLIGDPKLGG